MNNIELQDNGFPFTAQSVRFAQNSYGEAISKLAAAAGDNYIVYGCELVAGNRTAGAMVLNGEVIPFFASPNNAKVKIFDDVENAQYKSGIVLPAYHTRYAKCDATGTINFSDLRRLIAKTAPQPKETDWVTCEPTGDIVVAETIQARINDRGRVELKGKYSHINDFGWFYDFLIPEQFRPKYNRVSAVRLSADNTLLMYQLSIGTDGTARYSVSSSTIGSIVEIKSEYEL